MTTASCHTGIFQRSPAGRLEPVSQENIDYWCGQCQFTYQPPRCHDLNVIQRCWDYRNGNEWHLAHECPFAHLGMKCECNSYPSVKDAFEKLGLNYREE